MSKLLFTGVLAVTAALAAHPAVQAGEHRLQRVSITEDANWWRAAGNVADVFNSKNEVESIGCRIRGVVGYNDGVCFARDEKGRTLQCATSEDAILRAITAIGTDSTIEFAINKREGRCGSLVVTNASFNAPKRPTTPEVDAAALDITDLSVAP